MKHCVPLLQVLKFHFQNDREGDGELVAKLTKLVGEQDTARLLAAQRSHAAHIL